jgi:hypothetical protein
VEPDGRPAYAADMFELVGQERAMVLTLYTDAFVIRGSLVTRQHRMTDILNQPDDPFIVLEDVTTDEHGGRGEVVRAEYAQVNLASVLFAVSDEAVEPTPELRTPKVGEQALVSVPPFKVVGTIHLMPERELRAALEELTGRFVPMTDATFWSDSVAISRTSAGLVAFNHDRAQILAPHRVVDPWAGLDAGRPADVLPDQAS